MGLNELIEEIRNMERKEIPLSEAKRLAEKSTPLIVNVWTGEGIYATPTGYLVITKNKAFLFTSPTISRGYL